MQQSITPFRRSQALKLSLRLKILSIVLSETILIFGSARPSFGGEVIKCVRAGSADIVVSIDSRESLGRRLSCVYGDFVSDMTPCAPKGGFSMSAPTGDARIVQLFDKWPQILPGNLGGVTQFEWSNDSYVFTGYQPTSMLKGMVSRRMVWAFRVSRLSGRGLLLLYGQPEITYDCSLSTRLF